VVPYGAYPGISSVFRHLRDAGLCADFEREPYYTAGGFPRWDDAPEGSVLLLGGHTRYGPMLRQPGLKKYVLWTSAPLQSEMAEGEIKTLRQVFEHLAADRLDGVLFGDARMYQAYEHEHPGKVHWFPYPVASPPAYLPGRPFADREAAVSLFFPQHPRKNTFAQFLAVREAHRRSGLPTRVVTNCLPPVPVRGLNQLGWLSRPSYLHVLTNARLNLHVTVTESFGYQVIDALGQGVPSLVSETVARNLFHHQRRGISNLVSAAVMEDFENPVEMAASIQEFLQEPPLLERLWEAQRSALAETAAFHNQNLKSLLERLVQTP